MGLPTPKIHVKGLLQAIYLNGRDPLHTTTFQSNAKSVVKEALALRAQGKNVWIEVANSVESAINPELEWWWKGVHSPAGYALGREDALRNQSAESNPYLSENMKAEWLAGWTAGMIEQGKLPLQLQEPTKPKRKRRSA